MIDKNQGGEFTVELLLEWKSKHEQIIASLLRSHRSPLPLLRKVTEEGQFAQDVVDLLEQHGALFMDTHSEVLPHVILSLDRLRSELRVLARRIRYDKERTEPGKHHTSICKPRPAFLFPVGFVTDVI